MPARHAARTSLVRSAIEYSLGAGLGLVGSLLRVAMAARLLSAADRGLWLALQLGFGYAQNLHLGVLFGMFRDIPMLKARGDNEGAELAKITSWTFVNLMSALGWIALVIFIFGSRPSHDSLRYYVLTGLLTFVSLLKAYYICVFKSDSRFRDLSISAAIGSVTSIVTVALIWSSGLNGLIIGMILQALFEAAWLVRTEPMPRFGLDSRTLRRLLSVGTLTLLTSLSTILVTNVDRTVMLARLGTLQTGYYYIGANIAVLLPAVAGLPAAVLTPRFFEVFGATGRGDALTDLVETPVISGSVLFSACLGVISIAISPVVAHFFPDLEPGNTAARFAVAAAFPLVMVGLVVNVFYAMNRQVIQLVLIGVSAGMGFLAAEACVAVSPTIASAAAGSVVGPLSYYISAVLAAYWLMVRRWTRGARILVRSFAPAAFAAGLVALCDAVGSRWRPPSSLLRGALSELVFCVAFAPWLLRAARSLRR
jgi:O-antigen/teichoic acid export membrane protein